MRNVDLLRALTPALLIPAIALQASRRHLIRNLERSGATSPDRAIQLDPQSMLGRWWVTRLSDAGILRTTAEGASWLDGQAWSEYRRSRRRRALVVLAVAAAVLMFTKLTRP